ncbi:MAG: hypothetical protein QGG14_04450, partial [Planctomycetota bacterium]|nr:hypothetical protein [Planctomycetota bacterium]
MRKQYLDGSIPTGFQRTAMIGGGGTIPFRASELGSDRMLRIRQLTLEEDSCREVSDVGHRITFRTDRLGMPLIETVTEPDLLTPLDAARGNRLLAAIARSSGKVRRGPGAARQDVNVSIAGSRRVEIKGVPSWRWIPRLTHNEAFRHLNLLRLRRELLARSVNAAHLAISAKGLPWECSDLVVEASSIVRRSSFGPIWDAISRGDTICAVKLPGFGGLLEHPTQPGVTFAHEIEERVRVIACPTTRPFMIGRADYGVDAATWRAVRSALRAGEGDAVVLLWGAPEDAATAAREVLLRAQDSLVGVPSETRQASAGGNTGFERILPGPERMYPDTDTPPLPIVDAWVDTIDVVERPWERADRYVAAGVPAAAAEELATSPWAELFDDLSPSAPSTARRLAFAIIKRGHGLRARLGAETASAAERLRPLVEATDAGRISPHWFEAAFYELLVDSGPAEHILDRWRPSSDDCQQQEMDVVRANVAKLSGKSADARLRWAMGQVLSTVTMDPLQLRDRLVRELALTEDGA